MIRKKNLNERGITLIALVVTIIILLILSGVTLNMALSQDGLFSKTQEAADKYKQAQEDEELEIEKIEYAAEGKDIKKVETISDKEGFDDFRKKVNSGEDYNNTLIKLYNDIDLQNEDWTPIGTANYPFTGVFNGNGYKIKNLKLGETEENYKGLEDKNYIGLFGFNEGIIKNIGIESGKIDELVNAESILGMVVGYCTGIIENCYNEANINFTKSLYGFGGIAGRLGDGGCVSECYNKGKLILGSESGQSHGVGGIVCYGSENRNSKIEKCFNLGNINGYQSTMNNTMIGGICSNSIGIIDSCYNRGDITLDNTNGENHYYPAVGGIIGQAGMNSGVVLRNCYNVGNMTVEELEEVDVEVERIGSLTGYVSVNDSIMNVFCFKSDSFNSVGQCYGGDPKEKDIKEFTDVNNMKNIASELGSNFKADTNNKNEGFPILVWQDR